jgi:hypothetical protein
MDSTAEYRMRQQALTQHPYAAPADVVRFMGAVQAQEYPASLWSLGLRLPGWTAAEAEAELNAHAYIRTWLLRGTLHYVAPEDIGWMLALLGPAVISGQARRHRELALDQPTLERSAELLHGALADGNILTRPQLFAALEQHGISTAGQRGVYMLSYASLRGLIAQVAPRGRDTAFFALPETGLYPGRRVDDPLSALARRYFFSHGPASLDDYVWWSGLKKSDAEAGFEAARRELVSDRNGGRPLWRAPEIPPAEADAPNAHLLPAYDEYLIGYKDRSASVEPVHLPRVQMANGLGATVILAGRVIGTWRRNVRQSGITIEAAPFAPWSEADTELVAHAAERYGAFFGKRATLNAQSASD